MVKLMKYHREIFVWRERISGDVQDITDLRIGLDAFFQPVRLQPFAQIEDVDVHDIAFSLFVLSPYLSLDKIS